MIDFNEMKLHVFMIVDDKLGEKIVGPGVDAYWRGFVIEDRKTGKVSAKYRFKYPDGHKSWDSFSCKDNIDKKAQIAKLTAGLEDVINIAARAFGLDFRVKSFFPPDDGGDCWKTVEWLQKTDFVTITKVDAQAN